MRKKGPVGKTGNEVYRKKGKSEIKQEIKPEMKSGIKPEIKSQVKSEMKYKEYGKKKTKSEKFSWKPGNMLYPVPAVMVSCQRPGENPNIITVAWAGTICSSPAMVSISVRPERHSHDIIKETGEFVINLVTGSLLRAADYCGVKSGRDVDKFAEMKLTPFALDSVRAPGIEESPVNLACRVREIKRLGSHDLFLAEVVGVTVDGKYMDEKGKFHLNQAELVAYSHGEYFELGKKLGSFGYSVRKTQKKTAGRGKKK